MSFTEIRNCDLKFFYRFSTLPTEPNDILQWSQTSITVQSRSASKLIKRNNKGKKSSLGLS